MFTSFVCVVCHPTLCAPVAASPWTFFLGLYGPLYEASRIQERLWSPQSLYGPLSRPTVQSSRGSTGVKLPPIKFKPFQTRPVSDSGISESGWRAGLSQLGLVTANGKPVAESTW